MRKINIIVCLTLLFPLFLGAEEVNATFSPDSSKVAFTDGNHNLFVRNADGSDLRQLTFDGSATVLNGYASWVYYEEIFGRPSKYRAFWWSPDSQSIAFYRFDNSEVPLFPIYSPFNKEDGALQGLGGSLNNTRYPKAGQHNPEVKVGIVSLDSPSGIVWADFDPSQDQYFGTPFWGADSRRLFVQWMPRVQQRLELYEVDAKSGSKRSIYTETSQTWVSWMEDMLFTDKGLYMARDFQSGWQQIYFLSYDGKSFKQLTSGPNWRVNLLDIDPQGRVYFTAHRDSRLHSCLYRLGRKGRIERLTVLEENAANVQFSADFKSFEVDHSNINTPVRRFRYRTGSLDREQTSLCNKSEQPCPYYEIIWLTLEDGLKVPATVALPKDFDPSRKYPLVMEIYGGPDTPYVRDYYRRPSARAWWYYENGIIKVTADTRAAGHNGRAGLDLVYRDVVSVPVADCLAWAKHFASLDYVDASRMGVEGFSFGGTMTAMLVMNHPEYFRCGIAGGGVYDWHLYDSHYTERFMDTPQRNPEGYEKASAINYAGNYDCTRSYLKLTHGTGDDNVHLQNTLLMMDALQNRGQQFDLMLYPDGMHGYRGRQADHDLQADIIFWTNHLINN
ncbi:MAG: DPP IV N-terminal domain-containing protein [Candidatus Cryptobacteroides sp.]